MSQHDITTLNFTDKIILGCFDVILQRFHQCFHFQIVTPVSIEIGRQMSGMSLRKMARVSLKRANLEWHLVTTGRRPLAFIRVQILVKTTVNDKRQKARIPATKLQWLPARHAILTSGSGRTLDGRESLRAGRDAQLLPCRPAVRYPGPNAHTGPDGQTSVNQPLPARARHRRGTNRAIKDFRDIYRQPPQRSARHALIWCRGGGGIGDG